MAFVLPGILAMSLRDYELGWGTAGGSMLVAAGIVGAALGLLGAVM
jgi:hypothetical protein